MSGAIVSERVSSPEPQKKVENCFAMARTRWNVYNLVYRLLLSLVHHNHKNLMKSDYNSLTKINYYPNQTMYKVWLQLKHVPGSKGATRQNKVLTSTPAEIKLKT